jgi:hypothetical protein
MYQQLDINIAHEIFKFSVASWAIEKVLSPIFQGDRRPGQILVVLCYFYPCIGMTDDDTILLSDTEYTRFESDIE